MNSQEPLVTIMIITYNHVKFIATALDSVLNQKTSFPFNIHVIEDCSTDGTQQVLKEYAEKYPEKIKLFLNEKNIGFKVTQKNFVRGFKTLKAKYISILEGDDYWAYDGKLQRQVDFLEANPDFVGCGHNTIKFYSNEDLPSERFLYSGAIKPSHNLSDFIRVTSFFHLSTLVYRNVLKDSVPKQFLNPYSCDIFITMAHAAHGKVHYDNGDWARYRIHSGGRFSSIDLAKMWFFNIDGLRRYNAWFRYKYCDEFAIAIIKYCKHVQAQKKVGPYRLTLRQSMKLGYLICIYTLISLFFSLRSIRIKRKTFNINDYNYKIIDDVFLSEG